MLDSEEVNAFALPGGFFFVNSGLILKAESEAELAGVMAHEIAHAAVRHGTKQVTKVELMRMVAIVGSIAVGGWTGYAIRQGAGLAIPMGYLTFSAAEREADYLGLQYMYKSGDDPMAFVDFFEKIQTLERKKPGSISKVFSTHPMTDDRIKAAQNEIQTILAPKPVIATSPNSWTSRPALGCCITRTCWRTMDPRGTNKVQIHYLLRGKDVLSHLNLERVAEDRRARHAASCAPDASVIAGIRCDPAERG